MKNRLLAATAITAMSAAHPLLAQGLAFELDEIVFSVGLTEVAASQTGVTVDVLDEMDLRYGSDIQLSGTLATVPGLSVSQNGPTGTSATLRIRGLDTDYIPVYLNGIDITDPSSAQTGFDFGELVGAAATRVEILRGSQGAIYGSEAIGGVVNITSDFAPEETGTEVSLGVEAGSYDTYLATLGVGTRFDRGTLSFSATRLQTDGFSAADENDGNTEADGHDSTTLTLTGEYDLTDDLTVGLSAFYIDSFTEIDGFPAPNFTLTDTDDTQDTERYGARAYASFFTFGIDHEVSVSGARTERRYPGGFTEDFRGDRLSFAYLGTVELGSGDSLSFGLDQTREEFETDADAGDVETTAVFAEYLATLGSDIDLSASVRYDDHSDFGGQTTGRLAGVWRPMEGTRLRAAFATGFRAPSLFELYSGFFGNPDLTPEQSRSVELGVEQEFGDLMLGATLFYTEIDDLIRFSGGSYNQLAGTSTTQGVELFGEYAITDGLEVFGNYTYTEAEDQDGNRLRRVPRHDTTIGIAGEFGDAWTGSFSLQHVADRVDPDPMDDYTLANAQIGYGLSDTAEIYLRIENLFDEEYQTATGYGTSDRAFYVGLRTRF